MHLKKKIIVLFMVLTFFATPSYGDAPKEVIPPEITKETKQLYSEITLELDQEKVPYTLEEALSTALDNNFGIKSITARKNRQKWLYYQSMTNFLPNAGIDYNFSRFDGDILIDFTVLIERAGESIDLSYFGQWDLFTGLKRYYDFKQFKNLYKSASKQQDSTKNEVLFNTSSQYYRLLQAKFNIGIFEKSLESVKAQLKINQQKYEAGTGTKFDVLRAEAEVASFEQLLIESKNLFRLAQAQLSQTLGIDIFTRIDPAEKEIQKNDLFNEHLVLNELLDFALSNQPEIKVADFNLAAVRSRRNSAYSAYLPTVSVRGSYSKVGPDFSNIGSNTRKQIIASWNPGTGLGLTPFTEIKARNEEVKESKIEKIQVIRNTQQKILDVFNRINTAQEVIEAAKKEVISADESLRLSIVRLEAGVGIYTDVIKAQETQTRALVKYINAIIDYNILQAQMMFETGLISVNNLITGYTPQNIQPKKK